MAEEETDRTGKVLFLGLAQSGKTTIINTLIDGFNPMNIGKYQATINYERRHISHLEKKITIFDLGGQINFLDRYTGELAKFVFSKTSAVVFVVDSANVSELTRVKYYLDLAAEKIQRFSPETPLYLLLHKIDLLNPTMIRDVCDNLRTFLQSDLETQLKFFETSIMQKRAESVFTAFNSILGRIASDGELVSLETEESINSLSLIQNFMKQNSDIIEMAQLLAENGEPLIKGTRDFTHVTIFDTRKVLDNALQYIVKAPAEVTGSTVFETEDHIHFVRFLKTGKILLLSFSREKMEEKSENIPTLYDKVILLAKRVEEYS
ncbi:MAG: ADP-ribosylation factor-like protein [Candidatus Odinarchaeota archaeon]